MRVLSLIGLLLLGPLVLLSGGTAFAQYDSGAVVRPGSAPPSYGSRRYQERVAPRYEPRQRYAPAPQFRWGSGLAFEKSGP